MIERGTIAYIIDAGDQCYLCVMDQEKGSFHRFPVNDKNLARLAAESAAAVAKALGGYVKP